VAEAKKGDAKKEAEAPVAPIIIKKVQGEEGGGHGGAWKIALADMMTAMMAFFLLMWLLGATSEAKRKSIADYFKPTPKSLIQSGQMAGSNGILGGRSIMDPEGMPNAASQTSVLDLEPPRDPTDANDDGKGSEKDKDAGKGPQKTELAGNGPDSQTQAGKGPSPDQLTDEQKQKIAQEQDDKKLCQARNRSQRKNDGQ
jgi:chemotaxis protein MotB